MSKRILSCAALVALSSSCNASPPTDPTCSGTANISGTAQFDVGGAIVGTDGGAPSAVPLRTDLVVTGTASDGDGLAIRQVVVNGVAATNTGFDFSTWTATVPVASLAAQADAMGQAKVAVTATDSCGSTATLFTSTPFTVDLTPSVQVEMLTVTIKPPASLGFMPANGTIPSTILVTANPQAAGALVSLSSSFGTIQGAAGDVSSVTLSGDGQMGAASASLLFVSTVTGSALITASAKNLNSPAASVLVAGPPILVPAAATLAPGQQITVTALSQGNVAGCEITPGAGLTTSTMTIDSTHLQITISAAMSAMSGSTVQVVCQDAFNQLSTPGKYSVP